MTSGRPATEERCPACGGLLDPDPSLRGIDRLHGTPGDVSVRCCRTCGSGVTFPSASPAELGVFYPSGYGPYDDTLGAVSGAISRAVRWHQGHRALASTPLRALRGLPAGRAVDVGCGRGDLAGLLVERGWRVTGVEPSPAACRVARSRGVDALEGTLGDVVLESAAFDAAIFQHALEHTSDLAGDLAATVRALRPGGLLLVTVPNFACWQRRRFGDRWYHLDLPRHRIHLTPRGLRAALERAGVDVEALATSTTAVGLPASVQYRLAGRCLFPSGLALRVASGLCAAALPVSWSLDRAHGGGDQLHAVARRPA